MGFNDWPPFSEIRLLDISLLIPGVPASYMPLITGEIPDVVVPRSKILFLLTFAEANFIPLRVAVPEVPERYNFPITLFSIRQPGVTYE